MNRRLLLFATLGAALLTLAPAQTEPPRFESVPEPLGPKLWRLTWSSQIGKSYRLERSFDLRDWIEVDSVTATSLSAFLDDSELADQRTAFWRVGELGDKPVLVGDVFADFSPSGPDSAIACSLNVGGTETVIRVQFFDNGIPIGDALPGFGGSWSLAVDWDPDSPQVQRLEVGPNAMSPRGASCPSFPVETSFLIRPFGFSPS